MNGRMTTQLGAIELKNPVMCGSGEMVIDEAGIRSAIEAGAAAVFMKSTNESDVARAQLARSDYALLDSEWREIDWDFRPPPDASLFCRSGLTPQPFDAWLEMLATTDAYAREHDAFVIPSLIPADLDTAITYARRTEEAGARVLELNVAASHADEASQGALTLERSGDGVKRILSRFRDAIDIPIWVKLTGQSGNVTELAKGARDGGADAVTLAGRFMAFVPDVETMRPVLGTHAGFGGPWALPITCRFLVEARKELGASFPLIGTNGARSGLDVIRFLLSGASAVQMSSAVFAGGFGVLRGSIEAVQRYLEEHATEASTIVGAAADRLATYGEQEERPGYWRKFVPEGSSDA